MKSAGISKKNKFKHLTSRPLKNDRLFHSEAIENCIDDVSWKIKDPDIKRMIRERFSHAVEKSGHK